MTYSADQQEVFYIVEDIEKGRYDREDLLHQIASAAFKRAKDIGRVKMPDKPDKAPTPPRKRTAKVIRQDDAFVAPNRSPEALNFPVAPDDSPGGVHITVGGRRYKRSDFVGKTFVVQPGTYNDGRFTGMEAHITGAGGKSFRVEFKDKENAPRGPNNQGEVTFIWYNRVPYLFGK
jgi:hypothetical protein